MEHSYIFKEFLEPDEHIIWCDKPVKKGGNLIVTDVYYTIFGAFFFAFMMLLTLIIIIGSFLEGIGVTEVFAIVFGLLLALDGFYMCIGRRFVRKNIQEKTFYALTNKRILNIFKGKKTIIKEYPYSKAKVYVLEDRCMDGKGNILFENRYSKEFYPMTQIEAWYERKMFLAIDDRSIILNNFINIKDVKKVYEMIEMNKNAIASH